MYKWKLSENISSVLILGGGGRRRGKFGVNLALECLQAYFGMKICFTLNINIRRTA